MVDAFTGTNRYALTAVLIGATIGMVGMVRCFSDRGVALEWVFADACAPGTAVSTGRVGDGTVGGTCGSCFDVPVVDGPPPRSSDRPRRAILKRVPAISVGLGALLAAGLDVPPAMRQQSTPGTAILRTVVLLI